MRNQLVAGLVAGVFGLFAWACTTQPAPYPDAERFCAAKAKAICQASAICAVDPDACQMNQVMQCDTDASSAMASGTRAYSAEAAPACINALTTAFNGASVIAYADWLTLTDQCERVFVGNAGNNQPCASDYDCKNNLICSPATPGSSSSVCATAVVKNPGDFCSDPGSECPSDYYCAAPQPGASVQCIPAAPAGQACGTAIPCVSGQTCAGGVCASGATGSVPCGTSDDCGSLDPYCDPYAGSICTIGLTFATGAADCKGFLLGEVVSVADAGTE
jgi:hypothetical protein